MRRLSGTAYIYRTRWSSDEHTYERNEPSWTRYYVKTARRLRSITHWTSGVCEAIYIRSPFRPLRLLHKQQLRKAYSTATTSKPRNQTNSIQCSSSTPFSPWPLWLPPSPQSSLHLPQKSLMPSSLAKLNALADTTSSINNDIVRDQCENPKV